MSRFDLNLDVILNLTAPVAVKGALKGTINRLAALSEASEGDLSFVSQSKFKKDVPGSKASVLILPDDYEGEPNTNQVYLLHGNPSRAVDLIGEFMQRQLSPKPAAGIDPQAVLHPTVVIPESVHVGPFAVVEEGVEIGEGCVIGAFAYVGRFARLGAESVLKPRATVFDYCEIGRDCVIHTGAVIGADGFGYETVEGEHLRSPQIGIVVLEDHVDVGSNSTIDRARFSETRIGRGTKIDNHVQVAHNVTIGKGCFLASQVGIAGSSQIGDFVLMGGKAGVSGHLTIGDFCQIGGSTAVYKNLPAKSFVYGDPSMPYLQAQKFNVLRSKLPDLFRRVDKLENQSLSDQ